MGRADKRTGRPWCRPFAIPAVFILSLTASVAAQSGTAELIRDRI